jgi:hypothetical protein
MVDDGADPIDADLVMRAAAAVTSRGWRVSRTSKNGALPETE